MRRGVRRGVRRGEEGCEAELGGSGVRGGGLEEVSLMAGCTQWTVLERGAVSED